MTTDPGPEVANPHIHARQPRRSPPSLLYRYHILPNMKSLQSVSQSIRNNPTNHPTHQPINLHASLARTLTSGIPPINTASYLINASPCFGGQLSRPSCSTSTQSQNSSSIMNMVTGSPEKSEVKWARSRGLATSCVNVPWAMRVHGERLWLLGRGAFVSVCVGVFGRD